jgi:class 3 adenylate cyclase
VGSDERSLPELAQRSPSEEEVRRVRGIRTRAIQLDQRPGFVDWARRLRRSLPGDERFGDALSTAGESPVQVIARGVSSLQPDRESGIKELGLAGLQVWQSLSEAAGRGRGEVELALLFTDLVGFSSWALKAGDAAAVELLREVGEAVEGAVADQGGRIVKRLGDGVMATFLTAQAALDAALSAQDAVSVIHVAGYTPELRCGVHFGRPRKLGGDYLGVDVNIAARVADAAKGGQVLVSDPVLQRIRQDGLKLARSKRLRAQGAPRDLYVTAVSRANSG